jgi:hypothetical protein
MFWPPFSDWESVFVRKDPWLGLYISLWMANIWIQRKYFSTADLSFINRNDIDRQLIKFQSGDYRSRSSFPCSTILVMDDFWLLTIHPPACHLKCPGFNTPFFFFFFFYSIWDCGINTSQPIFIYFWKKLLLFLDF